MVVREEVRLMTYDCGAAGAGKKFPKWKSWVTVHIQVDEFQVGHRKF